MKYLIYCTKTKPTIFKWKATDGKREFDCACLYTKQLASVEDGELEKLILNGKVIAEFDGDIDTYTVNEDWYSNKVQVICKHLYGNVGEYETMNKGLLKEVLEKSCLTREQLTKYIIPDGKCHDMYCIKIKNLKVFDEPKELSDYMPFHPGLSSAQEYHNSLFSSHDNIAQVKRAPQNMMYVSSNGFDKLCLISIRPEWVLFLYNKLNISCSTILFFL